MVLPKPGHGWPPAAKVHGHLGNPLRGVARRPRARASRVPRERGIRFTFTEPDRELPLILGLRPVLKKAQWDGVNFRRIGHLGYSDRAPRPMSSTGSRPGARSC